ncbi:hypothetical protein M9H77_18955 [Catharanthus roseus]|uniref:Uncharacterized protein n=1 Tax=Catharanthus roseus TaxID=4058 RepID=A0ACC0B910_CATRO|nr:hypothetical protein M9H77_18955 [Catharanthus roseus]
MIEEFQGNLFSEKMFNIDRMDIARKRRRLNTKAMAEKVDISPAPPVPQPVIIPELAQSLLSDEVRRSILYRRYLLLNLGRNDDLGHVVSIIEAQVRVERGELHVRKGIIFMDWPPPIEVLRISDGVKSVRYGSFFPFFCLNLHIEFTIPHTHPFIH